MNICFLCDSIFTFGGVQRVLAVIAKALSASHRVTILTLDPPSIKDTTLYDLDQADIRYEFIHFAPPTRIEYLPCKAYSLLYKKVLPHTTLTSRWYAHSSFPASQSSLLVKKLNEGNYDVIVGVHVFLSLRLATIYNKLNAKQVIGWMHSSYQAFFEIHPGYIEGLKSHFVHQMRKLDRVVVLTHTDEQIYRQKLHLSPTVIYNPLTLAPQGRTNPNAQKFLAVGRLSPRTKGFDILIKGFALFAQHNKNWTLDIVGEGPEEILLRKLIADNGLEERVKLHPFTKEIQTYYAAASVYILSSRWEGLPLVLTEAMSHGLPIISSDIPVSRELLGSATNALLFKSEDEHDLAEKMVLMSESKELSRMGEESVARSKQFEVEKTVAQWEELFRL